MERAIALYLYLDFLLDARFPKNFAEHSGIEMISAALQKYFDEAMEAKGFDFQRYEQNTLVEVNDRRPFKYDECKRHQCRLVVDALNGGEVFKIASHPFFGRQCEVDSARFVSILRDLKLGVRLKEGGPALHDEIQHWGVERFKAGLPQVYRSMGGFYNPAKWIDFSEGPESSHTDLELPVPDVILSVDQDSPDVIEIRAAGLALIEQLHSTNDLGELTREEASAAANEVRQILTAFEGSRIRKRPVFDSASASLKWIASKSGDALFGVLATAMLASIAAYFGYHL